MMQQDAAICQLDDAQIPRGVGESTPGIEHASDYSGPRTPKRPRWTPRAEETIAHTSSRHSGPRAWRRALERSIAAGLLKGATATTVTVYEDLAERMDYSTGRVRYCLAAVMERTGLSRSAVTEHVRILREGGWLAWAEHGSLRNVMRQLGMPGYARTATVYAATIPAVFDEWAGNVLSGSGYGARVVGVTAEQRARMVAKTAERQQQRAGRTTQSGSSRTPSLRVVKEEGQVQEVDGSKNTSRKRAGTKTLRPLPYKRRTPAMAAHDIWTARQIRPRVSWTQGETLRRLAVAIRPLIDRGLDVQGIVEELHAWGLTWRPASPAAYIRCRLAQQAADAELFAGCIPWEQSTEYRRRQEQAEQQAREVIDDLPEAEPVPLDEDGFPDLKHFPRALVIDYRTAAMKDPHVVVRMLDATHLRYCDRLFTRKLCRQSLDLAYYGTSNIRLHI